VSSLKIISEPSEHGQIRVLYYTANFLPNVVNYVTLRAEGICALPQVARDRLDMTIVTPTPAGHFSDSRLPYRVVRQPGLRKLWRLVAEHDVVQLAGPCFLPLALALLRGRPVVMEHHSYNAICPNGLLLYGPTSTVCPGHFMARRYHKCLRCNATTQGWVQSFWKLLLGFPRRWMSARVRVNVCVTQHVAQRLGLPRSEVIYHGVVDTHCNNGPGARVGPGSPPICFASVGRLVTIKGLSLLLEAAGRLRDQGYAFRLKFIGDGAERGRLEGLASTLGLCDRVDFTGTLQGEDLEKAVSEVGVVVMPSVWEETAGLSAVEHMMRGRLVIASDIGGLGELVSDAGLKFPAGDAAALAECMRRVLDNPEIVGRLGSMARQRARALFRQERMIGDYVRLYQRLSEAAEESGRACARE